MKPAAAFPSASAEPVWADADRLPRGAQLASNLTTDVCVVGAGIAGLTTAYQLARAGRRVVVLDDGPLAGGMTYVTTAHLSNAIDDRFTNIEYWHGAEGARLAAESHAAAIDRIEQISQELDIDCDFRRVDGYLFADPTDDTHTLERELEAAHRAGVNAEMVARLPLKMLDGGPCIRFLRQARFHPLKYLSGLGNALVEMNVGLYTKQRAERIEGGDHATVQVGQHEVRASAVVVATNSPVNDMFALHTKQAPYMTYVIGARIAKGAVVDALYWDTLDPYHYVRLQELDDDYDLLIIGGEDHKSGQQPAGDQPHQKLEAWARLRFPIKNIEHAWGGQCMETVDGLAFIGRNPSDAPNVYVATGDSGMGITHGTIAGMLLSDLILGRENPWAGLYDPSRTSLRAAKEFVRENVNVAVQYADWVTPGEEKTPDDIEPGTGAVIRRGMRKFAVAKSEDGKVTELSAVCPHLGCIVHWNQVEGTWDCPCHGSRFQATGDVINGPANRPLDANS
ncbi:MAG: FAD-dependent oxidoreductase [Pirellulaceae bacterium]